MQKTRVHSFIRMYKMICMLLKMRNLKKFKYPKIDIVRKSDLDFVSDLLKVSKHICDLLKIIVNMKINQNKSDDEKSIIIGHVVYMYKLYDSIIYLITDERTEIAFVLLRTLSEVSIKLKYLITKIDSEICKRIKKASLVYDRKLWDHIEEKSKGRALLPIEIRIKASINETFQKAGFVIQDVEFRRDKYWCENSASIAKKLGLSDVYKTAYRMSSSAVHASWTFYQKYNLRCIDNKYQPELHYIGSDPRPIEGAGHIVLILAVDYLTILESDDCIRKLRDELTRANTWIQDMSKKHEEFLSKS